MSCNFRIVVSIFKTQPLEPSKFTSKKVEVGGFAPPSEHLLHPGTTSLALLD